MSDNRHIIIADANPHMQNSLVTTIARAAAAPVHILDTLPELLQMIPLQPPDVLIIDVATFCKGSVQTIEQLSSLYPQTAIIVFSFFSNSSLISLAADAGATGFVSKDARCEEVTKAIEAVERGREYYCHISVRLLAESQRQQKMKEGKYLHKALTEREILILRYSRRGLTNEQIANEMCLCKRTIESCKRAIGHKTNTRRINEMIQWARERGLLE